STLKSPSYTKSVSWQHYPPFQPDFIGTAFTKKYFNRSRL
ncbi:transposase, partial [Shigella flexneri]